MSTVSLKRKRNDDDDDGAASSAIESTEFAKREPKRRRTKDPYRVVLEHVQHYPLALSQDAYAEFRDDKEVVMESVKRAGWMLKHASPRLQNDPQVVLEVVRVDGGLLCYASSEIKANRDIVVAAVRQCGRAISGVAPELRRDKEIALAALENDSAAIKYVDVGLRSDVDVVASYIRSMPGIRPNRLTDLRTATRQYMIAASIADEMRFAANRLARLAATEGLPAEMSFRDAPGVAHGTAVREFVQNWKSSAYRMWLLRQAACPNNMALENQKLILAYAGFGFRSEFDLADKLSRLVPIFAALASHEIGYEHVWEAFPASTPSR